MAAAPKTYAYSIQLERFYKTQRFHWVICSTRNPDRLVSWGHAPSHELAVAAAQSEIQNLRSGRTLGGPVRDAKNGDVSRSH